jgi:calpain
LIPSSLKSKLDLKIQHDGESWIEYKDFIKHFDDVEICHLGPNGISCQKKKVWKTANLKGEWQDDFHHNTQILLQVHGSNKKEKYTTVISLMQESVYRSHNDIKFKIYETVGKTQRNLPEELNEIYQKMVPLYTSELSEKREINKRLELAPGSYLIIPYAETTEDKNFLLRVFCDTKISLKKL